MPCYDVATLVEEAVVGASRSILQARNRTQIFLFTKERYCFSKIVYLFFHFQFVISGLFNYVHIRVRYRVLCVCTLI